MQGLKFCYGCASALTFECFSVNGAKRDGLSTRCRKCQSKKWKTRGGTCADCGGHRAEGSAVRCKRCYAKRVDERGRFRFFQTPEYYNRKAVDLYFDHRTPWPEVYQQLMAIAEQMAAQKAREPEADGMNLNSYLFRGRWTPSLDQERYEGEDAGHVTWGDLLAQEYAD